MDQQQIKRRQGAGNVEGVLYEIIILTYLLWDALINTRNKLIKSFSFSNNLLGKSICGLRYDFNHLNDASYSRIMFLKTKFRQESEEIAIKIKLDKDDHRNCINSSESINIKNQKKRNRAICLSNMYHKVYKELKNEFKNTKNSEHPIYGNDFTNFKYVIYTNASIYLDGFKFNHSDIFDKYRFESDILNNLFHCGSNNSLNCFVFKTSVVKNLVKTMLGNVSAEEINEAEEFIKSVVFVTQQPDDKKLKDVLKELIGKQYSIPSYELDEKFPLLEDKMKTWWSTENECLIQSNTFIQDSLKLSFHFDVKESFIKFAGRERECDDIFKYHFQSQSQVVAIIGCGGLGKTSLAKEYIKRKGHLYNDNIIWIDAKEISQSFNKLAARLNIDTANKYNEQDNQELILKIFNCFKGRKCLFVFDNAMNNEEFKKFIPLQRLQWKPHILITSRDRDWVGVGKSLDLKVLQNFEAIELVCTSLNIQKSAEVETFVKTLHSYPLVLRQAIESIINSSKNITQFLQEYENIKRNVLKFSLDSCNDPYNSSVYNTWNITINEIKGKENGELAIKLLHIMAYIAPLNIEKSLFTKLDENELNISMALRYLVKHSMINFDYDVFSIHEVVQEVHRIKNENEEEIKILNETLSLFIGNISSTTVNHAMHAWVHAKIYKNLVEEFSFISHHIIETLIHESRFTNAYAFSQDVLHTFKSYNLESSKAEDVINVKKHLAKIYFHQSDYKNSLNEYVEANNMEIELYGKHANCVYDTKNQIALISRQKGEFKDALNEFEKLLKDELVHLGEENSVTLFTKNEIATIYQHLGMYDKALKEHLKIKEIKINLREKECLTKGISCNIMHDESILHTMDEIALVYNFLGMHQESEKEFDELLKLKREFLNENDSSISRTINNFGVLRIRQGKFDKALELFEIRLNKLNTAHEIITSSTMVTTYNISLVYYLQGKYKDALSLCQKNLDNISELFSDTHIKTLQVAQLKGDILLKLGNYVDALNIFEDVINKAQATIGRETMETLQTRNSIGCVYLAQKKFEKALKQFQKVYKMKVSHFYENHPEPLITQHYIGVVYKEQGFLSKGLAILQDVYEKKMKILGNEHYSTKQTQDEIEEIIKNIKWHNYVSDIIFEHHVLFILCLFVLFIYFYFYAVYIGTWITDFITIVN